MALKIGALLPRSTDYPRMGFDMLDALKCSLNAKGHNDTQFVTENIGYGEDHKLSYAKAEKLLMEEAVDLLVVYSSRINAEALYPIANVAGQPILFLDAGMQFPQEKTPELCYHITLQGLHACRHSGNMAGKGGRKGLIASSFYEGGYNGPYCSVRGLEESGGAVCANFVSGYKISEFNIDKYMELLPTAGAECIVANFSTYLCDLFMKALKAAAPGSVSLPFYCGPFMGEEQMLEQVPYPGGDFHVVMPWARGIDNPAQRSFSEMIQKDKNKQANIFHLLGWEAGTVAAQITGNGIGSLKGWSYDSPRGKVTFHPDTQHTYAPLYEAMIAGNEEGNCKIAIKGSMDIAADDHAKVLADKPEGMVSGWKNNYLCI